MLSRSTRRESGDICPIICRYYDGKNVSLVCSCCINLLFTFSFLLNEWGLDCGLRYSWYCFSVWFQRKLLYFFFHFKLLLLAYNFEVRPVNTRRGWVFSSFMNLFESCEENNSDIIVINSDENYILSWRDIIEDLTRVHINKKAVKGGDENIVSIIFFGWWGQGKFTYGDWFYVWVRREIFLLN